MASSLLKLLGTSGEADDEHGNNEADSSSASGESWDNDDLSEESDNPKLVKQPEIPEEVEKGDDTDSLIGVDGTQIESNEITEPDDIGFCKTSTAHYRFWTGHPALLPWLEDT